MTDFEPPSDDLPFADDDAPPPQSSPQEPRRGLPGWLSALIVVVLCAGAGIGAYLLTKDDDKETTRTPPTLEDESSFDVDRNALLGLLREARERTVHATYRQPDGTTIQVWRKGGLSRSEAQAKDEGGATVTLVSIHGGGNDVDCRRTGTGPWSCEDGDPLPSFEQSVEEELAIRDVEEAPDIEVAGVKARCFTLTGDEQTSEVCVDEHGLIVRLKTESVGLELVESDDDVNDSVFEPPA